MIGIELQLLDTRYAEMAGLWLIATVLCGFLLGLTTPALRARCARPAVVLACLAVGFLAWLGPGVDADEMEHLHSAWLMSHGMLPYVDFWQHHSPAVWILLAPLVGHAPHSAAVMDLSRIGCMILAALGGLLALVIARALHGSARVGPYVVILWLSAILPCQLWNLRPDLFSNVCSVAAVVLLVLPRRGWTVLAAGFLVGAAAALTTKHVPLAIVLPLALTGERLGWRRTLALLGLHALGVACGLAPLVGWLKLHGLWQEFLHWVLNYNHDPRLQVGGVFPFLLVLPAALWVLRIRANRWLALQPAERVMLVALVASGAVLLVQPFHKFMYDLQLFALLAAAAAGRETQLGMSWLFRTNRAAQAAGLVGLLFVPTFVFTMYAREEQLYFRNRAEIGALLAAAGEGPVVSVPPAHPILAYDATDLSQFWQWERWLYRPEVRARLRPMVRQIITGKPTVVKAGGSQIARTKIGAHTGIRWLFVQSLTEAQVVQPLEGLRLQEYLETHYNLISLFDHYYWLRADRPVPAEAHVELARREPGEPAESDEDEES